MKTLRSHLDLLNLIKEFYLEYSCLQLANSNNFLAMFHGGLSDEVGEDGEGEGEDGLDQAGTVLGVTLLATETLALQVGHSLHHHLVLHHVVRQGGAQAGALLAGPVTQGAPQGTQTWPDSQHLSPDNLVLTCHGADVAIQDEMIEYAGGHVGVPHVQDVLAPVNAELGRVFTSLSY